MKNKCAVTVLLASLFFLPNICFSQAEGSAFTLTGMGVSTPFASDYQSLGINPGNLDIKYKYEKHVTLGLFEVGASFYSEALTRSQLRGSLFNKNNESLTRQEQLDFTKKFAESDNTFDIKTTNVGLSVQTNKIGTFAYSMSERVSFNSSLSQNITNLLFLGATSPYFDFLVVTNAQGGVDTIPNGIYSEAVYDSVLSGISLLQDAQTISQLLEGSKLRFTWTREINFGYGKKVWSNDDFQIHAGFNSKVIIGQGLMFIDAQRSGTRAISAFSPIFKIDYSEIGSDNPSALEPNSPSFKPVGLGFGMDFGGTVVFKEKFTLGIAINDIGSIKWDGNLYTLKDTILVSSENQGIDGQNFLDQLDKLNGSDGILNWQGKTVLKTDLPTTLRIGLGYQNKFIRVGLDIITPINDESINTDETVIAIGGEYTPLQWLHLQAGIVNGGDYGTKIPLGIYFTVGKNGTYEFGLSSRDFIGYFRDNKPSASASLGFLRFRF